MAAHPRSDFQGPSSQHNPWNMAGEARRPEAMGENGLALARMCMVLPNLLLKQAGSGLQLAYSEMFKS